MIKLIGGAFSAKCPFVFLLFFSFFSATGPFSVGGTVGSWRGDRENAHVGDLEDAGAACSVVVVNHYFSNSPWYLRIWSTTYIHLPSVLRTYSIPEPAFWGGRLLAVATPNLVRALGTYQPASGIGRHSCIATWDIEVPPWLFFPFEFKASFTRRPEECETVVEKNI